jgi:hypothetical protein
VHDFSGGQCFCTAEKFFGASKDASSSYGILGSPGGSPSQKPSEFGAQKKLVINHWLKPVAWIVDGANHATDFSP